MTAEFQAAASPNVQMFPGIGQPGLDTNQYVNAMQDNLGAAGWTLSAAQMDRLTGAGDEQGPYPYDTLGPTDRDRSARGM